MLKNAILFILVGILSLSSDIFAAPAICQEAPEMIQIDALIPEISEIAIARAQECYAARLVQTENSIIDYICPSGDYSWSNRPHTREILAYQLAVAAVFQKIDENAIQYSKSLQCKRDTDPIKWQQTLKIFTDNNTGYASKYEATCSIPFILGLLNIDPENKKIETTDTFPQWDCQTLAKAKSEALHNLGLLLASNWVGKGFQNDKDNFLEGVKWAYRNLLNKMDNYLKIVGRAIHKLDTYTKNPIQ